MSPQTARPSKHFFALLATKLQPFLPLARLNFKFPFRNVIRMAILMLRPQVTFIHGIIPKRLSAKFARKVFVSKMCFDMAKETGAPSESLVALDTIEWRIRVNGFV